jgi:hypothetical protein
LRRMAFGLQGYSPGNCANDEPSTYWYLVSSRLTRRAPDGA